MRRSIIIGDVIWFIVCTSPQFYIFCCTVSADAINSKGCGVGERKTVANGKAVERRLHPWIVNIDVKYSLTEDGLSVLSCAGSIITSRFVLTAAHCLTNGKCTPTRVKVFYNSSSASRGPYVSAKSVFFHPSYKNVGVHDLALLRLEEPLRFDQHVRPVCLEEKRSDFSRMKIVEPQWGRKKGNNGPRHLHASYGQVQPYNSCEKKLGIAKQQSHKWNSMLFCTQQQGDGIVGAISGGPIIASKKRKAVQMGVSSYTFCTKANGLRAHTMVRPYMTWIKKVVKFSAEWECRAKNHK